MFNDMEATSLGVRIEGIRACTHDKFAFMSLTDVNMDRATHDHCIKDLLK